MAHRAWRPRASFALGSAGSADRRRRAAAGGVHDGLRGRSARALLAPVLQARRVAGLDLRPREGVRRLRGPGHRLDARLRRGRVDAGRRRARAADVAPHGRLLVRGRAPRARSRRWPPARLAEPDERDGPAAAQADGRGRARSPGPRPRRRGRAATVPKRAATAPARRPGASRALGRLGRARGTRLRRSAPVTRRGQAHRLAAHRRALRADLDHRGAWQPRTRRSSRCWRGAASSPATPSADGLLRSVARDRRCRSIATTGRWQWLGRAAPRRRPRSGRSAHGARTLAGVAPLAAVSSRSRRGRSPRRRASACSSPAGVAARAAHGRCAWRGTAPLLRAAEYADADQAGRGRRRRLRCRAASRCSRCWPSTTTTPSTACAISASSRRRGSAPGRRRLGRAAACGVCALAAAGDARTRALVARAVGVRGLRGRERHSWLRFVARRPWRRRGRGAGGQHDRHGPGGGSRVGGSGRSPRRLPKTLLASTASARSSTSRSSNLSAGGPARRRRGHRLRRRRVARARAGAQRRHGVRSSCVPNDRAEEWNNAYSLWLARDVFAEGVLHRQRRHGAPGSASRRRCSTARRRPTSCSPSTRRSPRRGGDEGAARRHGRDATGQQGDRPRPTRTASTSGVTLIEPSAADPLAEALEATWRRDPSLYYEDGFQELVDRGGDDRRGAAIGAVEWVEVDDDADLATRPGARVPLLARMVAAPLSHRRPQRRRSPGWARCWRTAGSPRAATSRSSVGPGPGRADAGLRARRGARRTRRRCYRAEGGTSTRHAARRGRCVRGSHDAVVGIGGGRTLDVAKYAASLVGLPMVSVATSLAHDGLASPVASLEHSGHKASYGVQMPIAVDGRPRLRPPRPAASSCARAWATRSRTSARSPTGGWPRQVRGEPSTASPPRSRGRAPSRSCTATTACSTTRS